MPIIGIEYDEISGKRLQGIKGNVNVMNGIKIKNIEEAKLLYVGKEHKALRISFEFETKYKSGTQNVGELKIRGKVLVALKADDAKKTLEEWKNRKPWVNEEIMNFVLNRCFVDSITLLQKLALPLPFPLPRIKMNENLKKRKEENKK